MGLNLLRYKIRLWSVEAYKHHAAPHKIWCLRFDKCLPVGTIRTNNRNYLMIFLLANNMELIDSAN